MGKDKNLLILRYYYTFSSTFSGKKISRSRKLRPGDGLRRLAGSDYLAGSGRFAAGATLSSAFISRKVSVQTLDS